MLPIPPNNLKSSKSNANVLMYYGEIENLMSLKEPSDNTRMCQTLLKVQDLSYIEHHLERRLEAEDSELPYNDII
jgi:hypothetical protein